MIAASAGIQRLPAVIAPGWRLVIHGATVFILLILLIPELVYRRKKYRARYVITPG